MVYDRAKKGVRITVEVLERLIKMEKMMNDSE
jgi:hypothetical protein